MVVSVGCQGETTFLSCEILKLQMQKHLKLCRQFSFGHSTEMSASVPKLLMDVSTLNFLKAYCRIAIQENLVRLEECADRNVTKFALALAEVLHLGRKNDAAAQQAGPWLLGT